MDSAARAEINGAIERYLERLAAEIEADAKAACPVDTGTLAGSISHEVSGQVARIGSNVSYAAMVEIGTGPHIIRAKAARTLANRATGQVFGPIVHHPGTPAQPYLAPSLHRAR